MLIDNQNNLSATTDPSSPDILDDDSLLSDDSKSRIFY